MQSNIHIGHPISYEAAKKLLKGDLATVYRSILKDCCAPIYWFDRDDPNRRILSNGTVTFVQTPDVLIGITAAHVVNALIADFAKHNLQVQIMNAVVDNFSDKIIDISIKYDLATFRVDEELVSQLGKPLQPLLQWPPQPPQEGRGIMLAGYPGSERNEEGIVVGFGLFTALVSARTVTDKQITWLVEPENQIKNTAVLPPPSKYVMGGISGGPLITWLESDQHISTYVLGGIIIEHPDYSGNEFTIERVIAISADLIMNTGRILA